MKRTLLAMGFVPVLILAGCFIQSLNPFYTNESRTELPQIAGKWQLVNEKSEQENEKVKKITPWEISQDKMTTYNEKNLSSEIETVYFKVGSNVFVDATAGEPKQNEYWCAGVHPVHTIGKVELEGDKLIIIPADYNVLKKMVEEGKASLKFVEPVEKNNIVIYISKPEEWIEFLKANGGSAEVFKRENALTFKKVKQQ